MNRKFLDELFSSLNVEDESVLKSIKDKIMEKNGEQIEKHKTETATLKNDLKVKENLIDSLNEKIKENENIDIEAIKKEEYEKGIAEGSKEIETFKKTNALKEALGTFKARDSKLIEKMLDNEKLTFEEKDGNYEIKGLNEQIEDIKKTHSYLFESEDENPSINLGGTHSDKNPKDTPTTLSGALHEKYDKK